ncbi:amino acid ABC transporter permease [Pseudomonas sp. R76]|uniref:amino acid ABC transporter permease n=1 Tax=Pseudomonas sp. R76 TaxID=1573711 RepID=UPI00131FAD6F|nr:amino acid ABC transporter permease [Pseudomonas sp. R76]QHD06954.1 ABC transporter permease [Pseudomonas sp. R76]
MSSFNLSILLNGPYHDWLISGLLMSIELTLISLLLTIPLSIFIALLRMAPISVLRLIGQVYVEGARNIPLLVHMLFWYFAAPQLFPLELRTWFYAQNYEMISAIIALVLYTASYMSEDIRSGMRSIPKEQHEAGRSLGFGFFSIMKLVILPQSLRITIPPLINQTLNLWQNSSIAMVIGVAELMYQAGQVESATFQTFESFAFATAAYLTVSAAISLLSHWYQQNSLVRRG